MANQTPNILFALVAFIAICNASPAKLDRLNPSKLKVLARQEDIAAQTPYPPAGFQPEIRFDLPTDEKLIAPDNTYLPPVGEPAKTYGPPAKTYGPPEVGVKDEVEGISNSETPALPEDQPEKPQPEEDLPEASGEEEKSTDEESTVQQTEQDQPEDDSESEIDAETEAELIENEINRIQAEEGLIDAVPERIVLATGAARKSAKLRSEKLEIASPMKPVYFVNYNGQLYRLLN